MLWEVSESYGFSWGPLEKIVVHRGMYCGPCVYGNYVCTSVYVTACQHRGALPLFRPRLVQTGLSVLDVGV